MHVLTLAVFLLFRLGLAYAGSNREDVLSLLLPVMGDSKSSMEVWMGCLCSELFLRHICTIKQHLSVYACFIFSRWLE